MVRGSAWPSDGHVMCATIPGPTVPGESVPLRLQAGEGRPVSFMLDLGRGGVWGPGWNSQAWALGALWGPCRVVEHLEQGNGCGAQLGREAREGPEAGPGPEGLEAVSPGWGPIGQRGLGVEPQQGRGETGAQSLRCCSQGLAEVAQAWTAAYTAARVKVSPLLPLPLAGLCKNSVLQLVKGGDPRRSVLDLRPSPTPAPHPAPWGPPPEGSGGAPETLLGLPLLPTPGRWPLKATAERGRS